MAYRNDRAYVARREALKRQARANATPCWICGAPFPWGMLDNMGREAWKHPLSFTADHEQPIATGGRMLGALRPAHRSCNARRQTKPIKDVNKPRQPKRSREW